jgi:hypothetical protein
LPKDFADWDIEESVRHYKEAAFSDDLFSNESLSAESQLRAIDAAVMRAYNLPPRLERALLDLFAGAKRPVPHEFSSYYPENFSAWLPLANYESAVRHPSSTPWWDIYLKPLPPEHAGLFDDLIG